MASPKPRKSPDGGIVADFAGDRACRAQRSRPLVEVVPAGFGNRWEGRFLKEHWRICQEFFEQAGIEITEFHQLLITRLSRVALQVAILERRFDKGDLNQAEQHAYTSLQHQYLGIMRQLALRPPRSAAGDQGPDLRELLAGVSGEVA